MKLYFLLSIFLFLSCKLGQSKVNTISVSQLKDKISTSSNIQLVDVRTPNEFINGHIDHAILIELHTDNFKQNAIKKLDKTKPVYVYCKTGGRGKKASEILQKQGFEVYNLKGGYVQWKYKEILH